MAEQSNSETTAVNKSRTYTTDDPIKENTPLLRSRSKSRPAEVSTLDVRNLVIGNIVVCLYYIASALHSPTMDQYLYRRMEDQVYGNITRDSDLPGNFTCVLNKTDIRFSQQERAQELSSRQQMYFTVSRGLLAVVCITLVGAYSDVIGRKVLLTMSMCGCFLRYCILTAVIYWELDFNYYFIGETISGITGHDYVFLLASYAYAADNTPPKKSRTVAIAVVETSLGLAFAGTQTATGYFIQGTGFLLPSITSVLVLFLNIIFTLVFLPETLPASEARKKNCVGPCVGIRRILGLFCSENTRETRSLILLALFVFVFYMLPYTGISNTDTLFMLNQPFCWTPEKIGYYTMAGTALKQLLGVPVIKVLHHCTSDAVIGVVSSTALVASYALHGLAYTSLMMYGVAVLGALTFAISPTIRAIMSRMTARDKQGSLFTSQMQMQAVCTLVGTPVFGLLYQSTVDIYRGSMYLAMAGLQLISVILFSVLACRSSGVDHNIHVEEDVTIQDSQTVQDSGQIYSSVDITVSCDSQSSMYGSDPSTLAFRNSGRYVRSFETNSQSPEDSMDSSTSSV